MATQFPSKFDSKCPACEGKIHAGDMIAKLASGKYGHAQCPSTPEPVVSAEAVAIPLKNIVSKLQLAKERGLQYPKIRLEAADGRKVVLSIAGAKAKLPGSINITDGQPYGINTFYGRIVDGVAQVKDADILALLVAVNTNVAGFTAKQGQLTGHCCFCGKLIETKESLAVGYGPTCADKFGLPWGVAEEIAA
jgi:hypothetical protein